MSLTPQQLGELDSLLSDLADGRFSESRRSQLEDLIKAEPEALDAYIRFVALCSDLHEVSASALSTADADLRSAEDISQQTTNSHPQKRLRRNVLAQRWPLWASLGAVALAVAAALVVVAPWRGPRQSVSPGSETQIVGKVETTSGQVEIVHGEAETANAAVGHAIRLGQTISTIGEDAYATIRLEDETLLHLAGGTQVRFSAEDRDRIDVPYGNVTAEVAHRPADRPLVLQTSEANIEVLGTRLSVARDERRTNVDVLQGKIRVTRLSDRRTVTLSAGQSANVSPQSDLEPSTIEAVPDHWSLDFNDGLPAGWQTGQLVFDSLPEGSRAAVRTAGVMEKGRRRFQIRSDNAWSDGFFALHDDSWIHIRYRLEKPGTFLLYIVCRQQDFGEPIATVLTAGNLKQTRAHQWHTLTLPASELHRAKAKDQIELTGQLVAFQLVFDSPEHNPGLTIDRIWVTRGDPAPPRSPIESLER